MELFCGWNVEEFGTLLTKVIAYWKKKLKDHPGGKLKDKSAEKNVNGGAVAPKVSENQNSMRDRASDHSFDILTGNLASFWPFTGSLNEAECKDNGLNCLTEF